MRRFFALKTWLGLLFILLIMVEGVSVWKFFSIGNFRKAEASTQDSQKSTMRFKKLLGIYPKAFKEVSPKKDRKIATARTAEVLGLDKELTEEILAGRIDKINELEPEKRGPLKFKDFTNIQQEMTKLFEFEKEVSRLEVTLEQEINNMGRFSNGDTKDSPYDLAEDLNIIDDIIFGDLKDVVKKAPWVKLAENTGGDNEENSSKNENQNGNNNGNSNDNKNQNGNSNGNSNQNENQNGNENKNDGKRKEPFKAKTNPPSSDQLNGFCPLENEVVLNNPDLEQELEDLNEQTKGDGGENGNENQNGNENGNENDNSNNNGNGNGNGNQNGNEEESEDDSSGLPCNEVFCIKFSLGTAGGTLTQTKKNDYSINSSTNKILTSLEKLNSTSLRLKCNNKGFLGAGSKNFTITPKNYLVNFTLINKPIVFPKNPLYSKFEEILEQENQRVTEYDATRVAQSENLVGIKNPKKVSFAELEKIFKTYRKDVAEKLKQEAGKNLITEEKFTKDKEGYRYLWPQIDSFFLHMDNLRMTLGKIEANLATFLKETPVDGSKPGGPQR
ncbi:hypothetical protein AUJ78_01955 [Candidatus Peregrinibacteria bacterium CG1_02_41_10]|nr:MAG: hypothetical protein AUJ78_01955 [Candidatus Peregrinibacteria bacterium CG1_02_41_10]